MDAQLLAALIFAEASKKNIKEFNKDGTAVGWVVNNRFTKPERFKDGAGGFSSYGGDEFNKFITGNLTEEEQEYAKKAKQIASGIIRGEIADPTGGADHMYNPKIDKPNDWNVLLKETDAEPDHMYYPETYNSGVHSYRKETLRRKKAKKRK